MPNIIIGVVLLLGGIAATLFSNGQHIWYGAIVVGAISIVRGVVRLMSTPRG